MSQRSIDKTLLVIVACQIAAAMVFVFNRTIDADEGFYLAAAQRVADGLMPYVDFFFPQAPLMPLSFFALSKWGLTSLYLLRIIASLAGVGTTLVMYRLVRESLSDRNLAVVAAFLTAFSGLFLTWHSTFKPYAFVDLALLASFYFFVKTTREGASEKSIFLAWLLLGIAINFRSVFLILLPVYVYALLQQQKRGTLNAKVISMALIGLLFPSLPAIYLFAQAPGEFLFNNLGFHLQREPINPLSALLLHKLTVFGKFLALPQTILLIGMTIGSYVLLRARHIDGSPIYKPAAIFAALIGLIYLVPTPVHLQYFQQTLVFLIILSMPCVAFILKYDRMKTILRSASVLYLIGIVPFAYLFIIAPRETDHRFERGQLMQVISSINSNSSATDTLLSEWAGYSALSSRAQIPGSEHVGFHFPLQLSEEEYNRHHLLTNADIVEILGEQRPQLVVVDYKVYPEWQSALNANYRLVGQNDQTYVYRRTNEAL